MKPHNHDESMPHRPQGSRSMWLATSLLTVLIIFLLILTGKRDGSEATDATSPRLLIEEEFAHPNSTADALSVRYPDTTGHTRRSSEDASEANRLVSDILDGRISAKELPARIKRTTTEQDEIKMYARELLQSNDPDKRMCALLLLLEIVGPSEEVLNAIIGEQSARIQAFGVRWLFMHQQFAEWDSVCRRIADIMDPARFAIAVAAAGEEVNSIGNASVLAVLRYPQLSVFLADVVRTSPELRDRTRTLLWSEELDLVDHMALLDVLSLTGDPSAVETFKGVVASHPDIEIRRAAINKLLEFQLTNEDVAFLASVAEQTPLAALKRPLRRAIDQVSASIQAEGQRPHVLDSVVGAPVEKVDDQEAVGVYLRRLSRCSDDVLHANASELTKLIQALREASSEHLTNNMVESSQLVFSEYLLWRATK